MNPSLDPEVVAAAYEADPASAKAEYRAEFRTDVEGFVALEVVQACVDKGIYERPPQASTTYRSFTDPSGGSNDSMTGAIGHLDGDIVIVDAIREVRAPFDPESVVQEFVQLFKQSRCERHLRSSCGAMGC